jgi:hypothetical protein
MKEEELPSNHVIKTVSAQGEGDRLASRSRNRALGTRSTGIFGRS